MNLMKILNKRTCGGAHLSCLCLIWHFLKLKMWNFCNTVPVFRGQQLQSREGELEKQSTIHQLIIAMRHTVTVWTKEGQWMEKKKSSCIYLSLADSSQWVANPHCSILPCWNGNLDWCARSSYFSLPLTNNAQFHCISELLVIPTI